MYQSECDGYYLWLAGSDVLCMEDAGTDEDGNSR